MRDINAQELDFELHDLRVEQNTPEGQKVKEYMKLFLQKKLEHALKDVNDLLMQVESDPEKIKNDAVKRQQALESTKKVKEETGE